MDASQAVFLMNWFHNEGATVQLSWGYTGVKGCEQVWDSGSTEVCKNNVLSQFKVCNNEILEIHQRHTLWTENIAGCCGGPEIHANVFAGAPKIRRVTLNFPASSSQSQLYFIVFAEKIMKLYIGNMPAIIISKSADRQDLWYCDLIWFPGSSQYVTKACLA